MKISALVLTYNNANILERCLSSLDFTNEIVTIDSYSRDGTQAICNKFNTVFIQNEYINYTKQIEFGISKCKNDIIIIIDSDEEVKDKLKNEIKNSLLNFEIEKFSGFYIPRKVFFLNKYIQHGKWYPDYQFRIFNKHKIKIEHREIHSSVHPLFESLKLQNDLIHYTYENIFDYVERLNKYTSLEVTNFIESNRNFKKRKLLLNPLSEFLRMFFVNKGYKDGMAGFTLASLSSVYKFLSYLKYWEYLMSKKSNTELPPIKNKDFKFKFNKV
ncbi:MAG TPA: glycosyltransferase family 2 protein [Ignavibacteria bacterium]|nr:glycosyltransferase family 2 protein [Ignavibacteria bacterium]